MMSSGRDEESSNFLETVGNLMYSYGDESSPLEKCREFVLDVVYDQLRKTLNCALKCAHERGSDQIEMVDILFLFRRHPVQLNRIFQFIKSADVLRSVSGREAMSQNDPEIDELYSGMDDMKDDVKYNIYSRNVQSMYQAVKTFDVTGELRSLFDHANKWDEEKLGRLMRIARRVDMMDEAEYIEFSKARICSMCARNGKKNERSINRFLAWLGEPKIAPDAVPVLNYIASEIVCVIVEGALWSREEEKRGLFKNDEPVNALQLRHYKESLRRNKAFMNNGHVLTGYF